MQACVCVCVFFYLLSSDACISWLPTSWQQPLTCNCKWMEPLGESKPIYYLGKLSINGQPLAGVCHCLTLSDHFKLVLISHSQVWVPSDKLAQPVGPSETESTQNSVVLWYGHSLSGACILCKVTAGCDNRANKHFKCINMVFIFIPGPKASNGVICIKECRQCVQTFWCSPITTQCLFKTQDISMKFQSTMIVVEDMHFVIICSPNGFALL